MQRVGMIGLGAMGMPMARNIMQAGFPLAVWARRPGSTDELLAAGATAAPSPADLARWSDVVILSVTNSPDVAALMTRDDGILGGSHEGLVVVDTSTIDPEVSRAMADRARGRGAAFLDAPVSGGTQGARAGTLSIMVGGPAEALERVRGVLEAMGDKIFHVGPSGSGEVIKLANNMLVGTIAAATAEALTLGVKAGADLQTMAQVIGASTGASWQLANQFPLRAFNGEFKPGFQTDLLVKDLDLALTLAGDNRMPVALTALARQLYAAAQGAGFGQDDYTSVLRVVERAAGVEVRGAPDGGQ